LTGNQKPGYYKEDVNADESAAKVIWPQVKNDNRDDCYCPKSLDIVANHGLLWAFGHEPSLIGLT
jgi:hypothetical protein